MSMLCMHELPHASFCYSEIPHKKKKTTTNKPFYLFTSMLSLDQTACAAYIYLHVTHAAE